MKLNKLTSSAVVILALSGCAQQQQLSEHSSAGDPEAIKEKPSEKARGFKFFQSKAKSAQPSNTAKTSRQSVQKPTDGDIWQLIEDELAFANKVPDRKIEAQIDWLDGNQKYFNNTLPRANIYLPYILDKVLDAGLPSEVALLPFIESAYNPYAYSPSGAAGLWQFIPATGNEFGLDQSRWYEGRRDIVESTDAAIRYLQILNDMFNGDWLLTFAAYNGGPGTVQRAIEANQRQGLKTDFWSLELSAETRRYVPRIIALSKVITQPEKYDIERMSIPSKPGFEVLALEKPIDLAQAARIAGVDADDIYHLNPGYTRWVTPPGGPYHLVLPKDKSEDFLQQLAALPPRQWQPSQEYVVQKGDTLSKIAQRQKLSVRELTASNGINERTVLRIGQVLRLPGTNVVKPNFETAALDSYKVKAGDSLWSIAKANNLEVKDLLVWNKLASPSVIKVGQTLTFYKADKATETARSNYQVKQGDSLYKIARHFNVALQDLLAWNDLGHSATIKPGQQLRISRPN